MKKSFDSRTRRRVEMVIEKNLDYLVRFAMFRIGNREDAEDIVYDAVLRLLDKDVSDINESGLRLYLFRVVYNLCQDYFANKKIKLVSVQDLDISDDDGSEDLDIVEIERLNGLLENLPSREMEAVRMRVIDNLSFVEISRITQIPESTIKSRFKAGLERLRQAYFRKE